MQRERDSANLLQTATMMNATEDDAIHVMTATTSTNTLASAHTHTQTTHVEPPT